MGGATGVAGEEIGCLRRDAVFSATDDALGFFAVVDFAAALFLVFGTVGASTERVISLRFGGIASQVKVYGST